VVRLFQRTIQSSASCSGSGEEVWQQRLGAESAEPVEAESEPVEGSEPLAGSASAAASESEPAESASAASESEPVVSVFEEAFEPEPAEPAPAEASGSESAEFERETQEPIM